MRYWLNPSIGVMSLLTFAALTTAAGVSQVVPVNHDPDAARLVTSDIPNFWRVFDRASLTSAADLFQREYLDAGSPGLRDFTRSRIQTGRGLAATVAARPRYYAAIRENTMALDTTPGIKESIRKAFRGLKAIYPDAVFPDVYFLIGRLNSAGTTSSGGLLIGVEMNARDPGTPVDELSNWERAVTGQIAALPHIVAHELVHVQQQGNAANTLLAQALREGSADFIGELISGGTINRVQRTYGDAHERDLWEEFSAAMHGTDTSRWLFQGDRSNDRPADLGYYVGYKICETFYRRAANKPDAVRRILQMTDADAFLRQSNYSGGDR